MKNKDSKTQKSTHQNVWDRMTIIEFLKEYHARYNPKETKPKKDKRSSP